MSYFINGREGIKCGEKGTCHSQCFWGHLSLGAFKVPHPGQGPDLKPEFGGPGPATFLQCSPGGPRTPSKARVMLSRGLWAFG